MSIAKESLLFEEQTGISLPEEFIELYEEKGNGGFGPDYGFLGIVSGHKTDLGDSILELYKSLAKMTQSGTGQNHIFRLSILGVLFITA